MKKKLEHELVNHNYRCEEDNRVSKILYKILDEGIYVVSLFEIYTENSQKKTEEELKQDVREYQEYISTIKWEWINKGYRNIQVLHVLISGNTELAKSYIENSDCYWIFNSEENRLILYENQKSQFLDVRDCIEDVINMNEEKVNIKSSIVHMYYKLSKNYDTFRSMIITLSIIGINIVIFLIMDWSIDGEIYNAFIEQGGISYQTVIENHQYYRFITCMFLHSDIDHIFGNMIVLFFIGKEIEKRLGSLRYLVLYFIGGIVADCTSLGYNKLYDNMRISIGASGAIFAVVGSMIAILLLNREEFKEIGLPRLLFFVIITIANGLRVTGIDNAAHIGGLMGGAVLGYYLYQHKQKKENSSY